MATAEELDKEYAIACAYRDGELTLREITTKFGVSGRKIQKIRRAYNIPDRPHYSRKIVLADEDLEWLLTEYASDRYTVEQIGAKLNMSRFTVQRIRKEHGIPDREICVRPATNKTKTSTICVRCGLVLADGEAEFCRVCIRELSRGVVYRGDWVMEDERGAALDRLGG